MRRGLLPHFEFRFPRWGAIERAGISLEVREALEPWLVLGELSGPGGTTRTVDSSLERVQVLVAGLSGDRHVVTCNGYPLPLTSTGRAGQAVAGVRFRAWPSAEGFHPTIAPHVPLTFDIVDTWNGRSIGGCRYPRGPSGRTQFPDPAGQRPGSRGAASGALRSHRPFAGGSAAPGRGRTPRFSPHPRSAPLAADAQINWRRAWPVVCHMRKG